MNKHDGICTVKFERAGGLIIVEAAVNATKKCFLFDSGAEISVLNSIHFVKNSFDGINSISIKDVSSESSVSTVDCNTSSGLVKVHSLEFAGFVLNNLEVLFLNLSHLEKALNRNDIYGLIGFDMLKGKSLFLDYDNDILSLIKPEAFEAFFSNFAGKSLTVDLGTDTHLPTVDVIMGNKIYRFAIDTGAEANLIDKAVLSDIQDYFKISNETNLAGAFSNTQVKRGLITEMIAGGKRFLNSDAVIGDISHINKGRKNQVSGILGTPFLKSQPVLINFEQGKLFFIEKITDKQAFFDI